MNRIDELCEKFPQIPRSIIIKTDVLVEGVRYTPIMGQIGSWAVPDGTYAYDISMDDGYHSDVAKVKEGWIEKPLQMLFKDGSLAWIALNSKSPYEVQYEGGGRYMLYRDNEALEEIFFPPRPEWYGVKSKLDGQPLSTSISVFGDAYLCVVSPNYCVYYDTDDECYFCPIGRTINQLDEVGVGLKRAVSMEHLIEAFEVAYHDIKAKLGTQLDKRTPCGQEGCRCINLLFTGGAMYSRKKEAERYIRYIEGLRKALGGLPDVTFSLEVQALEEDDARRLYDVGLHVIYYNLEVWDEKMFEIACPGKAKYVGREHWLDCMVKATKIYERGHVGSNLVAGLEMLPPYGFKSIDEALESTLEGMEWMVQHGIVPTWNIFLASAATKSKVKEQAYVPPTEYFLRLGLECHKLIMKYDLYRPTPGLICRQGGCLSSKTEFAKLRWADKEYGGQRMALAELERMATGRRSKMLLQQGK